MLIRDLDPTIHDELKRRADVRGLSLQAYVTEVLHQHVAKPTLSEWLEELRQLDPIEVSGADAVARAREELL